MRVQLVDPRGDVRPYDHALGAALARQGAQVELVTSPFVYGRVAAGDGYSVSERFYRRSARYGEEARLRRRAARLVEHFPDMLRFRRDPGPADVRHYQWLPLEALDVRLLPGGRPRVMTLHNVIRRGGGRRATWTVRRLAKAMDAVVVHTRHGARLLDELGAGGHVRVIPHGAFEHLTRQRDEAPLPPELAAVEGPVLLCFGMVRPYKGVEVLLEAFRELEGAELWVVGRPLKGSMEPYEKLARRAPGRVRFVTRYVSERELPAYFRRADLVVLPHRSVDQSGVLYVAMAFGKAIVLSAVGGFREAVEDHDVGRLVPPGDAPALAAALRALLDDPAERGAMGRRAAAAASGPYSWDEVGRQTLRLYEDLRQ
ncbi:MAG: glycosyltransferase [Thermoleophilaceae bacterium]